jgi:hypothetical protein
MSRKGQMKSLSAGAEMWGVTRDPCSLHFNGESDVSFLASCGLFFQCHFHGEFDGRDVTQG